MIFVDTSAWFAAYVPTDPQHRAVSMLLRSADQPLVTTDYVLDETVTLLIARRERQRAINFGSDLLVKNTAQLELVAHADLVQAFQLMTQYRDKAWSFTDCTSLVVMQRLGIGEAISLDRHFRQMPGITVHP
jgi:predicted nucleic acid-binding protein